jgi:putative resolvase
MSNQRTLTSRVAAKLLGLNVKTLQRWDREGKLKPITRTSGNHRLYLESEIIALQGIKPSVPTRIVAYCRVSSPAQKPDLANQRRILEEFVVAKGLANIEFIEEVGGGLNMKRKKFLALMDGISRREVQTLVIAHKDRLVRFGFDWFEHHCATHGCELLILNQERLSPETEMVQDLMTIIHCFSSRLYGLARVAREVQFYEQERNYKKKLEEALKQ